MLRLSGGHLASLFDLGLPIEVAELPTDLAGLDRLLADAALLEPTDARRGGPPPLQRAHDHELDP
jgi:hypothetical protein